MSRRRRVVLLAGAVAVVALAGCQYANGSAGTLSADGNSASGVSFKAASQNGSGFGTAQVTESQRVPGAPVPVFETNTYAGEATCVTVSGNRATILFSTDLTKSTVEFGGPPASAYEIQVQQASPGDPTYLWRAEAYAGDLSHCSAPTDADVANMIPDTSGSTFTVGTEPPADT